MSPNTFLNNQEVTKERKDEELNRSSSSSSTNQDNQNQVDLNMANEQKSDDSILNLSSNLRDDLIAHFLKLSTLLKGVLLNADDKKKLIEMDGNLYRRLSLLSFGEHEGKLRDNLKSIDEDLLKHIKKDECGLFYELKSTMRGDIVDLLMRNLNFVCLLDGFASNEDKKCLIKKNTDLTHHLLDLNSKPICDLSNLIETDNEVNGDETKETDNRLSKETEINPRTDLKKKFDEVDFEFVYDNITKHITKTSCNFSADIVYSNYLNFSSVNYYMQANLRRIEARNDEIWLYLYFYVQPKDHNVDYWTMNASFELKIINPFDNKQTLSIPVKNHFFTKRSTSYSRDIFRFDSIVDYIKDDSIKLGVHLIVHSYKAFSK